MSIKRIGKVIVCAALVLAMGICAFATGCGGKNDETESAMQEVTAIGFMDTDGPKLEAVAVRYDKEIAKDAVDTGTFQLSNLGTGSVDNNGSGNVGDILKAYVNTSAEMSASGGTSEGNYVILEVYTDYTAKANLTFSESLVIKVTQVKDIKATDGTVLPASEEGMKNTLGSKLSGVAEYDISFPEYDGFKFYYSGSSNYRTDGAGYKVSNCFSQIDGEYHDEDLAYALWLPEDYSEDGTYAMVTLQNPAATEGTHPFESLITYRSAAYYISDEAQELVKEQHEGIDGLIVLVPVITERVNDNGGTPAQYEAVVSLWDYIIETYNVDPNYVYGSGQSVGGMILLDTNRNRDNFFAGILLYDDQWTQNYYIDTLFIRTISNDLSYSDSATMHYPRVDTNITWDYSYDTSGNKVYDGHDPLNYYYLVSDDNILLLNDANNNLSNDSWKEMKYLYKDLVDADLEQHVLDCSSMTLAQQNSEIESITEANASGDGLNINWISFTDENYFRRVDSSYQWLLSQSRDTEISREKLDINKPFEKADTQIQTDERKLSFVDSDTGEAVYFLTGKSGAGTQGYSGAWYNMGTRLDAVPGWLPEGMSWDTGVTIGHIESAEIISSNAIAIKYDTDMSGVYVKLKGDPVYNFRRESFRTDDFITVDPIGLYDASGNALSFTISNVYVNSTASTLSGVDARDYTKACPGSGCYIIIEFTGDISSAAQLMQLTTFHTDTVIANASFRYTALASQSS